MQLMQTSKHTNHVNQRSKPRNKNQQATHQRNHTHHVRKSSIRISLKTKLVKVYELLQLIEANK